MFQFEGDVTAQRLEQRAQHEAERFGILDRAAMPDGEQDIGDVLGRAFVLDMLDPEPPDRRGGRHGVSAALHEGGKDRLLLVAMAVAQRRHEFVRDAQACQPVKTRRQRIRQRFEAVAKPQLLVMGALRSPGREPRPPRHRPDSNGTSIRRRRKDLAPAFRP